MEYNTSHGDAALTTLGRIYTDEGYIQNSKYYYFRRDHLKDNREVWLADSSKVVQRTQYYPSGLLFGESVASGGSVQPYRHAGKEMQSMHGLNWYDNLARFRTVSDGSGFTGIDPLCEKYYAISPYAYCSDNPINAVDPDGMACYMPGNGNQNDDIPFKHPNIDFRSPFGSTSQPWDDDKFMPRDIQEQINTINSRERFGDFPYYMAGNANQDGKTNSSKGKSNKEIHVNIEAGFRAFIKLPIGTVIKGDELNKMIIVFCT